MTAKESEGITASDHADVDSIATGLEIDAGDILFRWDASTECWNACTGSNVAAFAERSPDGWREVGG